MIRQPRPYLYASSSFVRGPSVYLQRALLKTLAEQLSYLHNPRPFKNPHYTKNVNRRTKNLKAVLTQEREREKNEREKRRQEREENMDVDGQPVEDTTLEEDLPTCARTDILWRIPTDWLWQTRQLRPLLLSFLSGGTVISPGSRLDIIRLLR